MKRLLTLVAFFATVEASAQQVNPVPDYVFRNQMSVGRGTVTDTAAYFSIGPRYGANKGFMPPIVGDTATFSSGKRNGLLIFSVQKNKFLYWDSVRVQWSDMAGSSGSYITGTGITGYVPQYNGTTTIDTSALFTLGNRLGIGSSTFAYTSTNTANVELNGTAGGIVGFKRNDSARGYLWHTGDNMELANTTAGTLSFNTNSATRGSISSAGVWRLHNLAGTGDRVVQASSNGTLSASTSVTGLVDTLTISTRAWRQKGIDSVVSIIPAAGVGGSGTTNYVPKFTAGTTIGNSQIFDNGTNVGIGTTSPTTPLTVNGRGTFTDANGGVIIGQYLSIPGFGGIYSTQVAPSGSNYNFLVSGTNTYISSPNGFIRFDNAGTERMRIFANGRVGINTTTDAGYQLDVNGTLRSVNGANFATTSGNVGIGTASPNGKLDVANAGDVSIWATATSTGSASMYLYPTGGGVAQIGSVGAVPLVLLTNGSAKARITSDGELWINTTTDAGDYKLQVSGNIYNTGSAVLAATSGNVGVGVSNPDGELELLGGTLTAGTVGTYALLLGNSSRQIMSLGTDANYGYIQTWGSRSLNLNSQGNNTIINSGSGEVLIGATSDAGDYKLQVVGNARIGSGKLDIATTTTFGLGIARSGTSEVAGQIYNSNGILYTGVESSAGGQIFTGSSAYAAVIGSGANYPLQFATNNATRATINTAGELLIGSTTDAGAYALQVTGAMYTTSTITTASPSADPVKPWKLGSVQAGTVALDTANYVEVEINGVYYRLAIVTPL